MPDGGIRIEAGGITLEVDAEAIEDAQEEGGLGFNYALTKAHQEALAPIPGFESPIDGITTFRLMVAPMNPDENEENR
jgi:hypothetical protein